MTRYTAEELDNAAVRDLISDAEGAEHQAQHGPFYPDRGITAESLSAYARKCRDKIAAFQNGGAHAAALAPTV